MGKQRTWLEDKVMKDWTGSENSVFKMVGASNHTVDEREEHDYYATDPKAVEKLIEREELEYMLWEPACGEGHISKTLSAYGFHVDSTDLIYRNYGRGGGRLLKTNTTLLRKHYNKSTL